MGNGIINLAALQRLIYDARKQWKDYEKNPNIFLNNGNARKCIRI
jgi:hypothetical protein